MQQMRNKMETIVIIQPKKLDKIIQLDDKPADIQNNNENNQVELNKQFIIATAVVMLGFGFLILCSGISLMLCNIKPEIKIGEKVEIAIDKKNDLR